MTRARTRPTWSQFERAVLLIAALTWGSLEIAFWGARTSALTFILAVLIGRESARMWADWKREDKEPGPGPGPPGQAT